MSALQRQLASLEAQQQVVQKEGLPVVGLGVDYSILSKYDTMTMANNGQDAVMPMLSISLPIFRSKYKAKQKEVTFQVESKIHEQEALANSLMATYHMASFEEEQAHKLIAYIINKFKLRSRIFNCCCQLIVTLRKSLMKFWPFSKNY